MIRKYFEVFEFWLQIPFRGQSTQIVGLSSYPHIATTISLLSISNIYVRISNIFWQVKLEAQLFLKIIGANQILKAIIENLALKY